MNQCNFCYDVGLYTEKSAVSSNTGLYDAVLPKQCLCNLSFEKIRIYFSLVFHRSNVMLASMNIRDNEQIDCSDDENYFSQDVHYRTSSDGTRVWEPCGDDIVLLYEEIELKGYVPLEWQCPGRISPTQFDQINKEKSSITESNNSSTNNDQTKSEFDFDNDFGFDDGDTLSTSNSRVTKRTQGMSFVFFLTLFFVLLVINLLILYVVQCSKNLKQI